MILNKNNNNIFNFYKKNYWQIIIVNKIVQFLLFLKFTLLFFNNYNKKNIKFVPLTLKKT